MEERIRNLFRKYLTNTCTKEEFEEVFRHLENAGNDILMRQELRRIYEEEMDRLPSETFVGADGLMASPLDDLTTDADLRPRVAGGARKRRKLLPVLVAGVVVLLAGLCWLGYPLHRDADAVASPVLAKQETRRSESKHLVLPDSSQVWLNAASTLEFRGGFRADKGVREVNLTGEAFFDIQHAELSPFIIHTGKVSVEVLGTAFNIKAYPGQEKISILVKKGKVKVRVADKAVALLTMGQQVVISNSDSSIRQKALPSQPRSWQDGDLVYDDYTIGDILADLERVYNVSIGVGDAGVRKLRVSTAFRRKDGVKNILEVIGKLTDTEPVEENGQYMMK